LYDPTIVAEPLKWLGESVGFWIQTVILGVSAGGGILIIRSRGRQEARRATVDLIVQQNSDPDLNKAKCAIRAMHENHETNFAKHLQNHDSDEFKAILLVLNTYEFIGSGIRTHAFDEGVHKRLRCSSVIKDWEALDGFVADFRIQKQKQTLFQDFEWLYERWKKNPLKADSRR
jgi:hypothetical protein